MNFLCIIVIVLLVVLNCKLVYLVNTCMLVHLAARVYNTCMLVHLVARVYNTCMSVHLAARVYNTCMLVHLAARVYNTCIFVVRLICLSLTNMKRKKLKLCLFLVRN